MDRYLIKYLRDNADNQLSRKYIDYFKIELDWHIYNSENHISNNYYRNRKIGTKQRIVHLLQYSNALFSHLKNRNDNTKKVLSTLYYPINETMLALGYSIESPVWGSVGRDNIFGDIQTISWHKKVQNLIRNEDFHSFLDYKLHQQLEDFQNHLLKQYKNQDFKALFLYTDQYFYSKYNIEIFKKLNRPSFVFTHGLPGVYSLEVDNRSDYLMVWSQKIKENYVAIGFNPSKVKVVGNPKYKKIPSNNVLRSDLSDVLVLPVSSSLYHQHEYDQTILVDKSMAILYLYKVQNILKKRGVKKARYRLHPTLNRSWVHPFVDPSFYIQDTEPLQTSLKKTTLVIGATSTVLLEALIYGVNYIVFEPKDEDGLNLLNTSLVPPFDGSDPKLKIANDDLELENLIRSNALTDYTIVHDYIQDFDLSVLKEILD